MPVKQRRASTRLAAGVALALRSLRDSETFDQIAIIRRDPRLPGFEENEKAGTASDGFDYGVFEFVELFARALHGRPRAALKRSEDKALIRRFEHDFTDHMPIWVRLPMPA